MLPQKNSKTGNDGAEGEPHRGGVCSLFPIFGGVNRAFVTLVQALYWYYVDLYYVVRQLSYMYFFYVGLFVRTYFSSTTGVMCGSKLAEIYNRPVLP